MPAFFPLRCLHERASKVGYVASQADVRRAESLREQCCRRDCSWLVRLRVSLMSMNAQAHSARTRPRKRLVFHVLWAEIKHVARVRMVDLQYTQTSAAQKRLQSRVLIRWYCEPYAEQSSLATHAQLFEPHLGRTWDLRMRIGSVHGSRGCATASWALGKVE